MSHINLNICFCSTDNLHKTNKCLKSCCIENNYCSTIFKHILTNGNLNLFVVENSIETLDYELFSNNASLPDDSNFATLL